MRGGALTLASATLIAVYATPTPSTVNTAGDSTTNTYEAGTPWWPLNGLYGIALVADVRGTAAGTRLGCEFVQLTRLHVLMYRATTGGSDGRRLHGPVGAVPHAGHGGHRNP